MTWAVSAVLIVAGFLASRITWKRIAQAWDEALTQARAKELAA